MDLFRSLAKEVPDRMFDLSLSVVRETIKMGVHLFTGIKPLKNGDQVPKIQATLFQGDLPIGYPIGQRKPVRLRRDDARHKIVQGATGAGKTEWAINYVINRSKLGEGVVYLDNTDGVAARRILEGLPPERLKKTVFLDHSVEDYPLPVGFYSRSDRRSVSDSLTNWWIWFFTENLGVEGQWMTQELISYACKAVFAVPHTTFLEVVEMVRNPLARRWILSQLDPELHEDTVEWWQEFEDKSEEKQRFISESFLRRSRYLLSQSTLRDMLCQVPRNVYPYREWMDEGYTVLITAKESSGELITRTVMSLHMLNFWSTALYRDSVSDQSQRRPTVIVADEPQTWMGNNEELLKDIFSKARKYGLGIVCLFQDSSQMEAGKLIRVVLGNQPDLILFKCRDESDIQVGGVKLSDLPKRHFLARLDDHPPFQCRAPGKAPFVEDRSQFIKSQLHTWGKPWKRVSSEIKGRKRQWAGRANITENPSESQRNGSNPSVSPESQTETGGSSSSSLRIG